MKNLKNKKECGAKAFYSNLNLGFRKTLNSEIHFIIRKLLSNHGIAAFRNPDELVEIFMGLDDKFFATIFEKEEVIEETVNQLSELYTAMVVSEYHLIPKRFGENFKIVIGQEIVDMTIDFYLEKNGIIYPVWFDFKKPDYTLGLGTAKYYGDDERFFLLWKAGLEAFPGEKIVPAIMYMKGRDVKSTGLDQKNLFTIDLNVDESQRNILESRLIKQSEVEMSAKNITSDESKCAFCSYKNLCKIEKNDNSGMEIIEEVKKSSGKIQFTDAQQKVIAHRTGELRVLAGAGSGKTTCLVNRIISMIEDGTAKPKDFLLITFTEKGCREMKEKLQYWMEKKCPDIEGHFMVETFNSFGQRLIQKHYAELGFVSEPYLLDDVMGYDILTELSNKGYRVPHISYSKPFTRLFRAKGGIASLYDAIKLYKDEMNSGVPIADKSKMKAAQALGKQVVEDGEAFAKFEELVVEYNKILKNEMLIDYADQIEMCIKLLSTPDIRKHWNFKHIVVDEFQDTSLNQMKILGLLYKQSKYSSLLVCGDDAQAIFGFRGVGPENIIGFKNFYPQASDVYMVDNFRCTKQIVELANKVIDLNENQIKKDLIAHKDGEPVVYVDATDFTSDIVEIVKSELAKGTMLKDICVLAATRLECFAVRKMLAKEGISSVVSVAERYLDDTGIIGACGLASFLRDKEYLQGLLTYLVAKDIDYRYRVVKGETEAIAEKYIEAVEGVDDEALYGMYMAEIETLPQTPALEELKLFLNERYTKFSEVATYLHKLQTYESDKTTEADTKNYNAVSISTIHASKGREFKVVIISSMKTATVDYGKELAKDEIMPVFDEERIRLLYVAITRAMSRLYIVQTPNDGTNILNERIPLWDEAKFKYVFHAKIDRLPKPKNSKKKSV